MGSDATMREPARLARLGVGGWGVVRRPGAFEPVWVPPSFKTVLREILSGAGEEGSGGEVDGCDEGGLDARGVLRAVS